MKAVIVLLLALLASCSSDPDTNVDPSVDVGTIDAGTDSASDDVADDESDSGVAERSVFERGPYNVGHRRFDITYDADLEPGRTIKLSVWYPTRDEEGLPGLYVINLERPEVLRDATVSIEGQAPLLVFSHGNAALAEQSYFMTEFWASHGWVVVAPYHTGNTAFDIAANGGGVKLESAPLRPQDISAAMDAIYALEPPDPLAGKVSDDVVLSGHSFGGFTTLAASGATFDVDGMVALCSQENAPTECSMLDRMGVEDLFRTGFLDERIDVAIPQAPGGFVAFGEGVSTIDIPTLLLTGARDMTLLPSNEAEPIWASMNGPHMRLDLNAAGHFTFSNMCELLPLPPVLNDGCGEDFIPIDTAFELINAYSMAFAEYMLWGATEHEDLLRGTDTRYADHVSLDWKPESSLQ